MRRASTLTMLLRVAMVSGKECPGMDSIASMCCPDAPGTDGYTCPNAGFRVRLCTNVAFAPHANIILWPIDFHSQCGKGQCIPAGGFLCVDGQGELAADYICMAGHSCGRGVCVPAGHRLCGTSGTNHIQIT